MDKVNNVVNSIVPESGDPFWYRAERAVLDAIMSTKSNILDVIGVVQSGSVAEVAECVSRTGKLGSVGDMAKTLPHILSSLKVHLNSYLESRLEMAV